MGFLFIVSSICKDSDVHLLYERIPAAETQQTYAMARIRCVDTCKRLSGQWHKNLSSSVTREFSLGKVEDELASMIFHEPHYFHKTLSPEITVSVNELASCCSVKALDIQSYYVEKK